jgi:hypothetical protein
MLVRPDGKGVSDRSSGLSNDSAHITSDPLKLSLDSGGIHVSQRQAALPDQIKDVAGLQGTRIEVVNSAELSLSCNKLRKEDVRCEAFIRAIEIRLTDAL